MSSSDDELDRLIAEHQRRAATPVPLAEIAATWNNLVHPYSTMLAAAIRRPDLARAPNWLSLTAADREQVVLAFRHAVLLGRYCADAIRDQSQQLRGRQ